LDLDVLDTQCGFKLYRRKSGRIVTIQHLEHWSFECELLYIAGQKKIPIIEVPVTWREMEDDSKIKLLTDPIKMFRDILSIRILYLLGIWSLKDSLIQ
jgi:dolichyl-phosphate beta-glucosyltransferase